MRCKLRPSLLLLIAIAWIPATSAAHPSPAQPAPAQPARQDAEASMKRAVGFFRKHASAGGGYVYQLSEDLAKREGEGKVGPTTAWIQPPATPSVGQAYLHGYQRTGDPMLLEAAQETAGALLRGQLRSGGWDNKIEFDNDERQKYAYRVDGGSGKRLQNMTTFDDNKSQSAIQFLMQLDRQLNFQDAAIHEATLYALESLLKAQYPNGAWPQRYDSFPDPNEHEIKQASLPAKWSRVYPGNPYSSHYTLNDNTMSDLIVTALDAWEIYRDDRYLAAAEKGGDFFIRAQLPEPQPGWAQQYDRDMHPAWARKFEPPAITGGESQGVMRTLILLYRRTAAESQNADRFLEPLPRAIAYYRKSQLADGSLARFYELGSNRPLFFTKDYQLTYSSADMPTHYSFIVSSRIDRIEAELQEIRSTPIDKLWNSAKPGPPTSKPSASLAQRTEQVIKSLDSRGAWVEEGRLKYHDKDDPTRRVIRSETFIKNLDVLTDWIAANPSP